MFVTAITGVAVLHAVPNATGQANPDEDLANSIWGDIQTWGQEPAPPAHKFSNPIPVGMGARPIGMGEAFAALSDEISGVWYNPAGLAQMDKNEVQWMGGDRYTAAPYMGFLSASYMLQNRMVFALSYERPWHPTGYYPDVIAGSYAPFSTWTGPLVIGPGTAGTRIGFTDITDTTVQDFLRKAYRAYINPPFQEDTLVFTYATPLSPDENMSMGVNVKYLYTDGQYAVNNQPLDSATGWGLDLGFQYRQPLKDFGRELAFGLNLRDIAGQARFTGSNSSGREVALAPVSDLGLGWRTTDFFTHSELNLAADFLYIGDPAIGPDANRRLYLGGEMWFMNGKIGPRAGYRMFFNRLLSGPTVGISFRYLVEMDYAYMFPAENDVATNWVTLGYRWGGIKRDIPLPDVSCSVDPPIFAPRNGEYATFTLSADSKSGIDRWSLSIIDRNNMVVKSYQDRGEPPSQIIWGGENKAYQLLPDAEYTYLFTATDHQGSSSSTPVQTLKLYTPPKPQVEEEKIDQLRELIKQQQVEESAQDTSQDAQAMTGMKATAAAQKANTTLPPLPEAPKEPVAITPLAEARAQAGSFAYSHVNNVPFASSSIQPGPDGKKAYTVAFQTDQDNPKAILKDVAAVISTAASDVGDSVARYDVSAKYGSRVLRVVAPASVALSLSRGFTTPEKFLQAAAVTLDGSPISPSYR
jgi:hypothetical protein